MKILSPEAHRNLIPCFPQEQLFSIHNSVRNSLIDPNYQNNKNQLYFSTQP